MANTRKRHHWHRHVILLSSLLLILFCASHASAAFRHGIPPDGRWRFKLDLDPFAAGNRWRYCEFNCGNPDLRNGDFNDQASSYSICNRTNQVIGIRVSFWLHVGYNQLVYTNLITVDIDSCHVENIMESIDNQISSYQIRRVY